jgi:methionyl-tRNA formyltransferase
VARAIVLTSTALRHTFVVHAVASRLDVVGVWQEAKRFAPLELPGSPEDRDAIASHFLGRDASEREYFGAHDSLRLSPAVIRRVVGPGGCNEPSEVTAMRALAPDVVLVFGTEILRDEVIASFRGNLINLHLGLSPYYRGSGTNFWPLVNREPEYVGATIHYLDAGIDSGPIITRVRPDMRPTDGPHDVGNRAIISAAAVLTQVADAHARQPLAATPQGGGGRLYLRRHFTADAVRQCYRNFSDGMIADYLADRAQRDAALALA